MPVRDTLPPVTLQYAHLAAWIDAEPVLSQVRRLASAAGVPCWLVGGAIRDALLGRHPKDADCIYVAPPGASPLPEIIAAELDAPCIRYTRELTVERVIVGHQPYDFVRLESVGALHTELRRRDFTWNALALPLHLPLDTPEKCADALMDVSGGLGDLAAGEVRWTSPEVIADDPLRILRAYRLALSLCFALPEVTRTAILRHRELLTQPSGERVRDELMLILGQPGGAATLAALCLDGVLGVRFPAIDGMRDISQNGYHHLPVLEHTLECVHQLEMLCQAWPDPLADFADRLNERVASAFVPGRTRLALMKLALLFHDLGKPGTWKLREDGAITFIGHDQLSGELMRPYLVDLHLSQEEIGYIDALVRGHLRPGFLDLEAPTARRMVHRYFAALGDYGVDLALISIADRLAAQGPLLKPHHLARHWKIVRHLCHVWWEEQSTVVSPPPLLGGDDLLEALGLTPGPRIGQLLRQIREAQAVGEIGTREDALQLASRLLNGVQEN